jgi:hypothetical protein
MLPIIVWSACHEKKNEINEKIRASPKRNKKLPKITFCCLESVKLIFLRVLEVVFLARVFFLTIN